MIFRLADYISHPLAIKHFHDILLQVQYWSREKRNEWIKERLEKVLLHAIKHVPYYKRTLVPFESHINEFVDRLDLSELPFITKEIIRENYKELQAENIKENRTYITRTSGTTGTPTEFLMDKNSNISHFASIWRVLNWVGYSFGNRFADLSGQIPKKNRLYEYDIRLNCLRLSSSNFKKKYIPIYLKELKKFNPVLIKAYPSSMDLFCRWLKELGLDSYRPKAVLSCAESLQEYQKINIEKTLQCPVFDFYNQNERAALISTCERQKYHIHEEYSFVEIVEPESQDIAAGEIVATTLHNFAMPLIRYRTKDFTTFDNDTICHCGRNYRQVKKIIGRIEDIIITPDGRHVTGLCNAFLYSPGIRIGQIIQQNVNEIQVNIVKSQHYNNRDQLNLERELRARLGDEISIYFNFVDFIAPDRSGKHPLVISKPARELVKELYKS